MVKRMWNFVFFSKFDGLTSWVGADMWKSVNIIVDTREAFRGNHHMKTCSQNAEKRVFLNVDNFLRRATDDTR